MHIKVIITKNRIEVALTLIFKRVVLRFGPKIRLGSVLPDILLDERLFTFTPFFHSDKILVEKLRI